MFCLQVKKEKKDKKEKKHKKPKQRIFIQLVPMMASEPQPPRDFDEACRTQPPTKLLTEGATDVFEEFLQVQPRAVGP